MAANDGRAYGDPCVPLSNKSGTPAGNARTFTRASFATATILELAPIWVHWHDAGARQLPMCVGGFAVWHAALDAAGGKVAMASRLGWGLEHMSTDTFCSRRPSCAPARRRRVVDLGGSSSRPSVR